jgi:hypothetical protein
VSEGILEGPVPMVKLSPRKNMVGVPEILLSWMTQRSGGPQGNIFTKRIIHSSRTFFLKILALGFSTT